MSFRNFIWNASAIKESRRRCRIERSYRKKVFESHYKTRNVHRQPSLATIMSRCIFQLSGNSAIKYRHRRHVTKKRTLRDPVCFLRIETRTRVRVFPHAWHVRWLTKIFVSFGHRRSVPDSSRYSSEGILISRFFPRSARASFKLCMRFANETPLNYRCFVT